MWTSLAEIAANVAQVFAFLVGGIWVLTRFIIQREHLPKASVTHKIAHLRLPTDNILLRVSILIKNPGSVVLQIESAIVRVQRVVPVPTDIRDAIERGEPPPEHQGQIPWPSEQRLDLTWGNEEFEIEPGESDEVTREFILSGDLKVIRIYTYFKNLRKKERDIGWGLSTLYDVGDERGTVQKTVEDLSGKGDVMSTRAESTRLDEDEQQPPEREQEPRRKQQPPEREPVRRQQPPEPDRYRRPQQPPEEDPPEEDSDEED